MMDDTTAIAEAASAHVSTIQGGMLLVDKRLGWIRLRSRFPYAIFLVDEAYDKLKSTYGVLDKMRLVLVNGGA